MSDPTSWSDLNGPAERALASYLSHRRLANQPDRIYKLGLREIEAPTGGIVSAHVQKADGMERRALRDVLECDRPGREGRRLAGTGS